MYEKIIIKRMFKDKSDISRWNYKRADGYWIQRTAKI